jgi:sec-independent protein translocase protein TatA
MHLIASFPGFLAFGIPSGPDLLILLVIVLVLFGAKRLPELARGLGQSVNEFKKAKEEFDKEVAKTPETPTAVTTTAPVQPNAPAAAKDDQKQA